MAKRPLSEKPTAVRRRIRKTGQKLERDIGLLYKPIEEWDMEELARGRPRNKAGNFQGPQPIWLTPLIIKQAKDRLRVLTRDEVAFFAADATRVMHDLMQNNDVDDDGKPLVPPSVRLQAAQYVLDQTIGKPTQQVEVQGNVVLTSLLAKVMIDEDGEPAHPIIDAEVVEDEPEDDDEEDES
jgi:hypothetical protein